jgi:hypothetical protein
MERRKIYTFPYLEAALKDGAYQMKLEIFTYWQESGLNQWPFLSLVREGPWRFSMPSAGREYGLIVTDYVDGDFDIYKSTEGCLPLFT